MFPKDGVVRAFPVASALAISFFCQGCFEAPPEPPTTPPTFQKYDGFIGDSDGSADEVKGLAAKTLSLDEAQRLCQAEKTCVGFSFQGEMGQARQLVHFKSHALMYNDCWVSYKKTQGGYEEHDGFISDDSNECSALATGKMSLRDAQQQCESENSCKGFTVRGYTHMELESANNVQAEVHFKKVWSSPVHNCWTSYLKEHPPPPSPPPRPTTPAPVESSNYYGAPVEEDTEEESDSQTDYYGAPAPAPAPVESSAYYAAPVEEDTEEESSAYYGAPSPAPAPVESSAYYS